MHSEFPRAVDPTSEPTVADRGPWLHSGGEVGDHEESPAAQPDEGERGGGSHNLRQRLSRRNSKILQRTGSEAVGEGPQQNMQKSGQEKHKGESHSGEGGGHFGSEEETVAVEGSGSGEWDGLESYGGQDIDRGSRVRSSKSK